VHHSSAVFKNDAIIFIVKNKENIVIWLENTNSVVRDGYNVAKLIESSNQLHHNSWTT
jgi:hypothetical protein